MSKSGTHFHFKQFSVRHDRCSMKVGTDGVLLGAWVDISGAKNILDIGTGSGVIGLMLAQRTSENARIDAIEVEADDAHQAKENAEASPWPEKIRVHHTSLQGFNSDIKYDLIVSNPPFFINSHKPPGERRTQTRHTTSLDYETLVHRANDLLNEGGRFNVILPYTEGLHFIDLAYRNKFYCSRKCSFRTRQEKPIERWMLEFTRLEKGTSEEEVLLYSNELNWSDAYKSLTGAFYLKV
jgi:tRNA1Val (adenine37-N6)-methyltransferase